MMILVEFLQAAKEIMDREEFNELRGKDKRKIFDLFLVLNSEYYTNADSDGCSFHDYAFGCGNPYESAAVCPAAWTAGACV